MNQQAQIALKIQLRDHNDANYGNFKVFRFDDLNATIKELGDKVKQVLGVELIYQELYLNRDGVLERLVDGTLQRYDVRNEDEIVVKHTMIDKWPTYLRYMDQIRRLQDTNEKKKAADRSRRLMEDLMNANFFDAYGGFEAEYQSFSIKFMFLLYNTEEHLKKSVQKYFNKKFPAKTVNVYTPKNIGGNQLGYFVDLVEGNDVRSFYAKTMGYVPKGDRPSDIKEKVDLREIFVLQLLRLIGIGPPEVHIIPDSSGSEYLYLATKLIPDFYTANGKSVDWMQDKKDIQKPDVNEPDRTTAEEQLRVLIWLLDLDDVGDENEDNYGYVQRQISDGHELRIVDFRVCLNGSSSSSKPKLADFKHLTEWKLNDEKIDEARKAVIEDKVIHELMDRPKNDNDEEEGTSKKEEDTRKKEKDTPKVPPEEVLDLDDYIKRIKGKLGKARKRAHASEPEKASKAPKK